MNYYDILGISQNATPASIKNAYRKLAMKYHPDRANGDQNKEEQFKKINEAYNTLSNPEKKAQYDNSLHSSPFDYSYGNDSFENEQLHTFMAKMFGGFSPFDDFFDASPSFKHKKTFQQQKISVTLTFWESIEGVKKEITYTNKNNQSQTIQIQFPPGIEDETLIEAQVSYNEKIFILIHINNDTPFIKRNLDLHMKIEINMVHAALGTTIDFPFKNKTLSVTIPEGTQYGDVITIANEGVHKGMSQGNLYIQCIVTTPQHLNKKQKDLLAKLYPNKK